MWFQPGKTPPKPWSEPLATRWSRVRLEDMVPGRTMCADCMLVPGVVRVVLLVWGVTATSAGSISTVGTEQDLFFSFLDLNTTQLGQ